jgi:hypothetical protein
MSKAILLLSLALVTSTSRGQSQIREHTFQQFKVPVYQGKSAKPNFKSLRGSNDFRTRIRDGFRNGPNYAGHFAIVPFGCGTSCIMGFLIDVKSGRIFDIPLGGEENYSLRLDYRPNSRLLKARWIDTSNDDNWFDHPLCVRQEFILNGSMFKLLTQAKHRVDETNDCFPE